MRNILVVNAGSSSIISRFFPSTETLERLIKFRLMASTNAISCAP